MRTPRQSHPLGTPIAVSPLGTPIKKTWRKKDVADTHVSDTHAESSTPAVRVVESAYHGLRMEDPAETFLWYDLETSGTSPAHDRIVQFAGLRTDADLNPVEPPFSTYVQLGPEVVPWPEALLITGIAPQTMASGRSEWEAMTEIHRIFETPRTCVVGYNNLLFDDEFIRYTFYRNLLDPYAREWRDGNSRWDILDLVRAAGALRPEGIEWPLVEGNPSFGLQAIAEANGLAHKNPHDALSDVHATIGVAGLIRTRQPRLYQYGLSLRSKDAARRMLLPFGRDICLHSGRSFGRARYGTAPVLSIAQHPEIDASIIVADLGRDVSTLIEDSAEDLAEALFAREAEERPPLHQVRLNRCPFLAPLNVLRPQDAERIGIDRELVLERQAALVATPDLDSKIAQVYVRRDHDRDDGLRDVEERLYEGFTSNADRSRCDDLQRELRAGAPWPDTSFSDPRLEELAERLRVRLRPESLDDSGRSAWNRYVADRLTGEHPRRLSVAEYRRDVEERLNGGDGNREVLRALRAYGEELERRTHA